MILFLCGLSGFFVAQFVKTLSPVRPKPPVSLVVAAGGAFLVAFLVLHQARDIVAYGLAGAGLAVGYHRLSRAISVLGDFLIREILRRARPR